MPDIIYTFDVLFLISSSVRCRDASERMRGREVSIEYWASGGARKVVSVHVPSFRETIHTLGTTRSPTRSPTRSAGLEGIKDVDIGKRLSVLLLDLKRLDSESRVTVPLGEMLRLRLTERW